MVKKSVLMMLLTCIILNLTACNANESSQPSANTINFDLSQYESHGELSCNRIWCSKVEGSWDTANTEYFAYFDNNGNQLSDWYQLAHYSYGYVPQDYKNNFVILHESLGYPSLSDKREVIILDYSGKNIASLYVKFNNISASYLGITDFNSDGLSCCYGRTYNDDKDSLYWIDNSGAHKFQIDATKIVRVYSPDSMIVTKMDDGNILLSLGGSYNYYTAVFSLQGYLITDIREAIGGYEVYSVTTNGDNFTVSFRGADGKRYSCVISRSGKFVEQPH